MKHALYFVGASGFSVKEYAPQRHRVRMVGPFEKPHGRLPRRPSVPSASRNHHERNFFIAAHLELSRRTRLRAEFSSGSKIRRMG